MKKGIFLLFLLLVGVRSLSVLQYGFPFDPAEDPSTGNFNAYSSPSYPLGTLSVGTSINIKFSIPNPLTYTIGSIAFQILREINGAFVPTSFVPSTFTSTSLQFNHEVGFPSSTALSGEYWIRIIGPSSLVEVDYYYLQVTSYNTASGYSVGGNSIQTLLKIVDVMRRTILKYVYIATPSNLSFSAAPAYSATTYALTFTQITPQTATRTNGFQLGQPLTVTKSYHPLMQSIDFFINDVPVGFYLITLTPSAMPGVRTISFFFQSDRYLCPYSPEFSDYYEVFQDCTTKAASQAGVPCLSYNTITGECSLCITGFTLTNGSCTVNTTCPARFYFKFGHCLPVSELCADYEAFTGNCLSCANHYRYELINGACLPRAEANCTDRQWILNFTCIDVSPYCQTFNISTGACLSCFQGYIIINGSCQVKIKQCAQNQYPAGDECFPIPAECSGFDKSIGRCHACITGYFLDGGQCLPIRCPEGQAPSRRGPFCVQISPLCEHYDPMNGDCLSCKNPLYSLQDGQCLQVISPLAGCADREKLGFGLCANVTLNCRTFNLKTGNCDACESGFFIDYTGVCQPNAVCGPNQWSVNGACMTMPDYCLAVNSLGFCTKCVSSEYRIVDGQCIYFKTCLPRQYLSASGACIYVSPQCDAFNPSNGMCISCMSGNQPSAGVCCPAGMVFSQTRKACISVNKAESGSECIIPHPSLGFCLKCPDGFAPDYSLPLHCAPS